jgi:uncharacterized lipoprotein YmbA
MLMRERRPASKGRWGPSADWAVAPRPERHPIDANAVGSYRLQLGEIADGFPAAEAVVQRFSDWQVVLAIESLWAAANSGG